MSDPRGSAGEYPSLRSTGYRSANHRIHGHCQDIADQLGEPKALVYTVICLEAWEEDIIGSRRVLGRELPEHESRWTTKQAADVCELIQKRVALLVAQYKRPFYLHTYNEDGTKVEKEWVKP